MENDTDPALFFLLDPDTMYDLRCPDCDVIISISDGAVFPGDRGKPNIGTDLDHEATLGDLLDAARAHECDLELVSADAQE